MQIYTLDRLWNVWGGGLGVTHRHGPFQVSQCVKRGMCELLHEHTIDVCNR